MKLADWRRGEGLTQQELADLLGVVIATVSRYETGDRIPEAETMRRIFWLSRHQVAPNDFYEMGDAPPDGLPQLPDPLAEAA
ncbi:DNA-binding XRE family transcriptional regulator [Sphingomonas zeicaulis]|uniref:helix-turn-helix domain-containing protein n=1 Tax=Sphingomonas zeicaulis TaxID=1632740 RepID=UPI003D1AC11B